MNRSTAWQRFVGGKLISFQEHAMQLDRSFWVTVARIVGLVIVVGIVLMALDFVTNGLFTKN